MSIYGYFDMLQANFFQQCNVTTKWVVPRMYKFYFQLLTASDKSFLCEHDIFVFI